MHRCLTSRLQWTHRQQPAAELNTGVSQQSRVAKQAISGMILNNYVMERIRLAAVAGSFYPASAERLRKTVETLLAQAQSKTLEGKLRGLIVPHAGYIYSGPVAATGYKTVHAARGLCLRQPQAGEDVRSRRSLGGGLS